MSTAIDIGGKLTGAAYAHPLKFIGVVVFLLLAPFLGKPLHVDDALFVWSAQHISAHPGNFYGFAVDWTGYTVPMSTENRNPPANSYYLAAVGSVFGWGEIVLHAAMLLVTFAAVAGIYQLARLWCERPMLATIIALVTPVFLVSATSLMCDVPTLAIWTWAVVFWERALKSGKAPEYFAAAFLAGLAVLTKYSALTLLPLLPIMGFLQKRRAGFWLIWLVVPAIIIGLYECWTAKLYGRGLIESAVGFASDSNSNSVGVRLSKLALGVEFTGASFLPSLLFLPWLWGRRDVAIVMAISAAAATAIMGMTSLPTGLCWSSRFQMWLWMLAGIHVMLISVCAIWKWRDIISWVLVMWVGGGLGFAAVLNWTVSGRSFLPLAPAIAILVVRGLRSPNQ